MFRFIDEIILLATDDDTGRFYPIPKKSFNLAIAGAMLFELSFKHLIDNDLHEVFVANHEVSGNKWTDTILDRLVMNGGRLPILQALSLVELDADEIVETALNDLVRSGVLIENSQWKAGTSDRRYYKKDLQLVTSIRRRIREILLEGSIPDPEDLVTLNLIQVCNLGGYLFSAQELEKTGERTKLLSNLELIGQNILREIRKLERMSPEQMAGVLLDIRNDPSKILTGGLPAVRSAMKHIFRQTGILRATTLLRQVNHENGFDCPSCAWPDPEHEKAVFRFCENGVKSIASEATDACVPADFFERWSVEELRQQSDLWLEKQGRLIQPMLLREGSSHYVPVSYDGACKYIAAHLAGLEDPNEAVFYTSGKASNESAFLFQLLARDFGTNNLPGSANLCHEASSAALSQTLGFPKGTVELDDFEKADAIFIFGHNPGSTHPRMMQSLENAVKRGCRIVVVNPMVEPSLIRFSNPKNISLKNARETVIADLYIQPVINGDLAFIKGMIKYLLEAEQRTPGEVVDKNFISDHTAGYKELQQHILDSDWEDIVNRSGVQKEEIEAAAKIYLASEPVIVSWCLGITHHKNAVATVREIVNLMLLRGNIGKPGAGLCPARGHSNVQGNRTMGIHTMENRQFSERLSEVYGIRPDRKPGLDAVSAIIAMHRERIRVFISLGGNLASAAPDRAFTETAFSRCDLTVMVSTKLNRNHFVTGKNAILLPCFGRTEKDILDGSLQSLSFEDMSGLIRLSKGCVSPASDRLLSDIQIIAMIAGELGGKLKGTVPWVTFSLNYSTIREHIARIIPEFKMSGDS